MGGGHPAEAAAVLQAPTPNTGIVGVRLPLPLSKEEWVIAPLSSLAKLLITSLWIGLCVASGQVKGVEIWHETIFPSHPLLCRQKVRPLPLRAASLLRERGARLALFSQFRASCPCPPGTTWTSPPRPCPPSRLRCWEWPSTGTRRGWCTPTSSTSWQRYAQGLWVRLSSHSGHSCGVCPCSFWNCFLSYQLLETKFVFPFLNFEKKDGNLYLQI